MKITKESKYSEKACLYSLGSDESALLELALCQPNDKDAVMELILAEKTILPLLNRGPFDKKMAYRICVAYPVHAKSVLGQLLPAADAFGLSLEAARAFKLLSQFEADYFNYQDFLKTFPEEANEIFCRLLGNDVFFCSFVDYYQTLKKLLKELPSYRQRLIEALVRQSDQHWCKVFEEETWLFALVAEECPDQRHILFNRYFNVPGLYHENFSFGDADAFISKLLNLALVLDERSSNTFGIIILKILVTLFPEHKKSFFDLLCAHPAALARLLADTPLKFLELVELSPVESRDNLLKAVRQLPPYPGAFGLFTHNVIDLQSENHTWIAAKEIIKLREYFPNDTTPFLDKLCNEEILLAKMLSNSNGFAYAVDWAIKFPHLRKKFIEAYNKEQGQSHFTISEQLIEAAPEEIQPILKLLSETTPGSDFGNMAILQVLLHVPDLFNRATQYLELHANETLDQSYRGIFPPEMWPWINALCKLPHSSVPDDLINDFCKMFPESGYKLVLFIVNNKNLCSTVFDSIPNAVAAAKLAPEFRRTVIQSIKEIGNKSIQKLFEAFPEEEDFIIDLIFKDKTQFTHFVSVGTRAVCRFSHDYPRHQTALASALIRFPKVFLSILFDGKFIYPFFILVANRQLFVQSLCVHVPAEKIKNIEFNDTLTAVHKLSQCMEYFIDYLFNIPNYYRQYRQHDFHLRTTAMLYGHQVQIISLLCGFPDTIDRLVDYCLENQSLETCPKEFRELISVSNDLKTAVEESNVLEIEACEKLIILKYNQGLFRRPQFCSLVKFVERLSDTVEDKSAESVVYQALQHLLVEVKNRTAFPTLSLLSARTVINVPSQFADNEICDDLQAIIEEVDGSPKKTESPK